MIVFIILNYKFKVKVITLKAIALKTMKWSLLQAKMSHQSPILGVKQGDRPQN